MRRVAILAACVAGLAGCKPAGDLENGIYPIASLNGAIVIDEKRMVLIFSDGTTLYAERDAQ